MLCTKGVATSGEAGLELTKDSDPQLCGRLRASRPKREVAMKVGVLGVATHVAGVGGDGSR